MGAIKSVGSIVFATPIGWAVMAVALIVVTQMNAV